jgi:hypothetical protein
MLRLPGARGPGPAKRPVRRVICDRSSQLWVIMVVLAGVAASGATADPSDLKLRIDSQAQFLSPTAVLVPVTYDCPAGGGTTELGAGVFQGEEQAAFMELNAANAPPRLP